MNKKNLLFLLSFLATAAFAEPMSQIKTKHFDIIYADKIETAARILYENIDTYAEEIAKKLDKKIEGRMPIYLVADSQTLNGYYSGSVYKHIVINVAPPASGELENLENSLLRVFYHEYTHALSLGFAYILVPNNILFPTSFKEGVAVAFESSYDGKFGRIYDPLVWHPIIQNKLDRRFPSFTQTGLGRDMYPYSKWVYYYGAAFSQYLIDTYGEKKYAELWKADWRLFVKHKFYNVYQIPLDDVWNNFVQSVKTPTSVKQPKILSESLEKSGYLFPVVANSDLYFYDFNDKYLYKYDGKAKGEAIVYLGDSIDSLAISDDGETLLISKSKPLLNSTQTNWGQYEVSLYSLKESRFLNETYDYAREADFATNSKIVAVKIGRGATSNLVLLDRATKREMNLFTAGFDKKYSAIYHPTFIGDNKIAFIAAKGLIRDILIIDINTNKIEKLNLDPSIKAVRYLQATATKEDRFLTFAWADIEKNMLYRSAKLNLRTKKLEIQTYDVSGGSFYPVLYKDEILSVARYDIYNKLNVIPNEYLQQSSFNLEAVDVKEITKSKDIFKKSKPNSSSFNSFTSEWLWANPNIGLALEIPNRILELGAIGLGVNFGITDPTEFIYANLETIFYIHPFFTQLKANFGVKDKGFDFRLKGYEMLKGYNSARVRKTGLGFNLNYATPLAHNRQTFEFEYDFATDWAHKVYEYDKTEFSPKAIFWQKSTAAILSAYKKKYSDNLLIHSAGLKFSDVRTNSVIRSMFFAKDISKISYGAKFGHSYDLWNKQNAAYFLNRLEGITPVVPLRLGLSGFVGYNSYLQASSGSVYYFNKDWLIDDNTGGFVKKIFGFKSHKIDEVASSKLTGALGFDANLTIFDIELQDTASFIPLMFNRFKIDIEYDGILQFYSKSKKLATHYSDSISTALVLDFSGIELGVRMGTSLSTKPKFDIDIELKAAL